MEHCTMDFEKILVGDAMTAEVIKVRPGDSVVDVGNTLAERRISGAVVFEGNKILGVISKESFVASVKYMGASPIDSFFVRDFMSSRYETAKANEPLCKAVERINSSPQRVDRVLVTDDAEGGNLKGILTRSDISRVFSEHAKGCFKVRDLMLLHPPVVFDYAPIRDIVREITLSKDKRVIVMAGRKVLGVITVLDLSLVLFQKLKENPEKNAIDLVTLEDVITLDPVTTTANADSAEAAAVMVEKRIGGLPVVGQCLDGVLTKSEIVKGYCMYKDLKKRR